MKIFGLHKWVIMVCLVLGTALGFTPNTFAGAAGNIIPQSHGLEKGETGRVVRVIDGDSFVLASGLRVNLSFVQAPKMAWPEKNYGAWPFAKRSKAALETLVNEKTVQLYYHGDRRDRYERAQALVWIVDEGGQEREFVHEEMLLLGMARVYTWPQKKTKKQPGFDTGTLFGSENKARKQGLGIWNSSAANGFYDVRSPDPNMLAQYVDSVQIVQGIIISTAHVRGTTYLNFGTDYKTDFTIGISKKSQKFFKKAGYDPLLLIGAKVRVRGWIELQNGPVIWLNTPDRMEILN